MWDVFCVFFNTAVVPSVAELLCDMALLQELTTRTTGALVRSEATIHQRCKGRAGWRKRTRRSDVLVFQHSALHNS